MQVAPRHQTSGALAGATRRPTHHTSVHVAREHASTTGCPNCRDARRTTLRCQPGPAILAGVRTVLTRVSLVGALAIGTWTVGGCTDDDGRARPTADTTSGPIGDLRGGDVRDVIISVFCGADYLPIGVNDSTWRADELTTDDPYWVPAEWASVAETLDDISDSLVVQIRMEPGERRLIATANGRVVTYRPTTPDDPDNICA